MSFVLGSKSMERLAGVHSDMVGVILRAISIAEQDFMVLEGVRSKERQRQLFGQGRTANECKKAGISSGYAKPTMPKVTWTLKSNHFPGPDGFGRAVDLVPFPVDWNTTSKFDAIAKAMFKAAEELGVNIRWGADWDDDGKPRERGESDSPHFELEN